MDRNTNSVTVNADQAIWLDERRSMRAAPGALFCITVFTVIHYNRPDHSFIIIIITFDIELIWAQLDEDCGEVKPLSTSDWSF